MPNPGSSEAPFDLVSHGRRGPGRRDRLTPAQIAQISRTVRRVPEVMVKVLSTGTTSVKGVQKHLDYIGRKGELDLETDEGQKLRGEEAKDLLDDWDLDVDEHRHREGLESANGREPPRLIHKLMFSMPPGTPPDKVLGAVRNFCREEFALKHRYVMALHTDEPHPHVHVVVKAMSEQGKRLNIKKPMLREWRGKFAWQLRALGVEANATDRFVRGVTTQPLRDGIYRATLRGDSRRERDRTELAARALTTGTLQADAGKAKMMLTRTAMENGWSAVSEILLAEGHTALAAQVQRFADRVPAAQTDLEWVAARLQRRDLVTPLRESMPDLFVSR